MKEKVWQKFYECNCGSELVGISTDHYVDELYLAFFKQGLADENGITWKRQLRAIWHIIRYGTYWTDMVILTQEDAGKLGKDLIKFSKKGIPDESKK